MDLFTAEKILQQLQHQQQQQQNQFPFLMTATNPTMVAANNFEQFLLHQQQLNSLINNAAVMGHHLPPNPALLGNEFFLNTIDNQKRLIDHNCML